MKVVIFCGGLRVRMVASHLEDDPSFLATYGNGLTDASLPDEDMQQASVGINREPMNTIKDKQRLDAFAETSRAPWQQPKLVLEPQST